MLNIHDLSVSFNGDYLFEKVTFRLGAGDRIGLVGKNGAGKSTLLKILSREFEPDSGTIAADKEIRMGFLKQDIDFVQGRTVLEEAYQAFYEILQVEQQIDSVNQELSDRTDYESEDYHGLIEKSHKMPDKLPPKPFVPEQNQCLVLKNPSGFLCLQQSFLNQVQIHEKGF